MKRSKFGLFPIITLVVLSSSVLMFFQYRILKVDIETNQNQMDFAVASILMKVYDNTVLDQDLDRQMAKFSGTKEFTFGRNSTPEGAIEKLVKQKLDQVLSLNYPDTDYTVDGFISSEYGCLIHSNHRSELPKAKKVLSAENHLCFCMITTNTLDIAMAYTNKSATVLEDSAYAMAITFVLIMIIVGAFAYTIYTINRQKKLSDLKRDFINNLTHEFKTPIFSISLAVKSLLARQEIASSEKISSYVDLIGKEGKRLQTQVDKILQIALLDSGNLTLEKKTVDIHSVVQKVADDFEMILADKKGMLNLNLTATKHLVMADETHLNNIIYNLIDNAQKYSEQAPIIEATTIDGDDGVILTVKDNGIGIEKEVQQYVFDQFYRVPKGDVHDVKGFGLGLSYVKRMVEEHKGRISLKSQAKKGSEFTIYLPVA